MAACCIRGSFVSFVFSTISRTRRHYCSASDTLQKALDQYKDTKLSLFRVKSCDFEKSFSQAHVSVVEYVKDRYGNVRDPKWVTDEEIINHEVQGRFVNFKPLFKAGFDAIEQHLEKRPSIIDRSDQQLYAVYSLSAFLMNRDFHEDCLWNLTNNVHFHKLPEYKITAMLANHLFSKLTTNDKRENVCFITNDSLYKTDVCPCAKNCGAEVHYGKTGIGSEYLWYGQPDIMVFPDGGGVCNIVVTKYANDEFRKVDEPDSSIDGPTNFNKHIIELKCTSRDLRNSSIVQQIVAQTITFSLYQKKYQLEKQSLGHYPEVTTLIPIIAACADAFDIYMYDSKHDILLRNMDEPIPLWEFSSTGKRINKFNLSSIIQLWMLINHLTFCPCFTERQIKELNGSCGFFQNIDNVRLNIIEDTLDMTPHFFPVEIKDVSYKHVRADDSESDESLHLKPT